jgi:hypothetical protein
VPKSQVEQNDDGTFTMRPFLRGAAAAKHDEIGEHIGRSYHAVLMSKAG